MHILEHLFLVGEFPERARLLSGLTLEQVTLCPDGASHSIYDELWHAAGYQRFVIERGDASGDLYPRAAPEHEHQWHDLVREFLDGAHAAAAMGQQPERLALEVEPGVTMADEQPARNVIGGVLASVRAEPSGDRVEVDAESTKNLLGHAGASLLVGLSASRSCPRCPIPARTARVRACRR